MYGVIYKATNILNGKCYVGQTTRHLIKRIRGHCTSDANYYFSRALRKYGEDNFAWD